MEVWSAVVFPPRYWFPKKRLPKSFAASITQEQHETNLNFILSHFYVDTSGSYYHVSGALRILSGGMVAWCQFPSTRDLIPFIATNYFYFVAIFSFVLVITIIMKYYTRSSVDSKAFKELPDTVSKLSFPGVKYEFRTKSNMGVRITSIVLHKTSVV
jgi:hypothetical protein